MSRRVIRRALPALPILLIALLTLSPSGSSGSSAPTLCLFCSERSLADALLNVALFLPFGAALYAITGSLARAILWAATFSMGIEVAQIWIPGRDSNPGDLIINVIGAALGVAVMRTAPRWLRPAPSFRVRLAWAALVAALAALATAAALLAPDLPQTRYFGQWTPKFDQLEWYHGEVLEASVGSVRIPSRRVDDDAQLRRLLSAGAPIEVELIAGPPVSGLAPIFSIGDDRLDTILLLGIDRDDAVLRFRTRSTAVLLDQPDLRLQDGFADIGAGERLILRVTRDSDGFCFRIGPRERCGIGFGLADTWGVLLYSGSWTGWAGTVLGLAWLATLFVPTGFFLRTPAEVLVAAVFIVAGLIAIPWVTPVLAAAPHELVAALSGVACGMTIRHLSCPFDPHAA